MDMMSQFMRQDLRTRGELEARQSWTVNGARLAAAAPWVVLALLSSRPETASASERRNASRALATSASAAFRYASRTNGRRCGAYAVRDGQGRAELGGFRDESARLRQCARASRRPSP